MKKNFWLVSLMTLALVSCTNGENEVASNDALADLQVEVGLNKPVSRALIEDEYFKDGAVLGLSIEEADGSAYDEKAEGYTNIAYEATGDVTVTDDVASGQIWEAATPIRLGATPGTLYAYYPRVPDATNHSAVAVSNDNQDDWMYGTPVTNLSNSNAVAKITMNHAQAAVKVILKNSATKPYTSQGNVTAITLKSPCLGTTGTLDAETGITTVTDANAEDAIAVTPQDITPSGITFTHMMFPVNAFAASNEITVKITMDGKTFSNTLEVNDPFTKGNMYKITLTATANDFVLGSDTNGDGVIDENDEPAVSIVTWGSEVNVGEENMEVVPD